MLTGCLASLEEQRLHCLRTIAVIDQCSERAQETWRSRFPWVDFVFPSRVVNGAEARNLVIERAETPLVALLDADVVGEAGWLERCCARLRDTGAAIVVPLILYPRGVIHAAGNLEYQMEDDGVTYVFKEHRYWGMPFRGRCDLVPAQVDYAESHCFVCDVAAVKSFGGFDEQLVEFGEVDTGRRARSVGRTVWVEPEAVVLTQQDAPIEPEDVEVFERRWDPEAIARSRHHFMDVWGVDVGERGGFDEFVSVYNSKLGPLPRRLPRPWTVKLDRAVHLWIGRSRVVIRRSMRRLRPVIGSL